MKLERRADGWWIADVEPYTVDGATFTAYGPYRTKDQAQDDLRGIRRFYEGDKPKQALLDFEP